MYKGKVDALYERGILSKEEYDCIMSNMGVTEKGELIGVYPAKETKYKYNFNGDMLNTNPRDFLINNVTVPMGAEWMDKTFWTYGSTYSGIGDGWNWYRADSLTEYGRNEGHKAIEEAADEECWKMIAIASRYYYVQYKDDYIKAHLNDTYKYIGWAID